MDTYTKLTCKKCGKHFYIALGSMDDLTAPDIDGGNCPYCKEVNVFYFVDAHQEEVFTVDGVKQLL